MAEYPVQNQQPCSPTPVLTIVEQPAQHYRFRYQSELKDSHSRIGGLLLGRNSENNSKSFMKLQITGIDPTVHSQLQLIACTVSSDKGAHPYYLHGDNCHDGYFEIIKDIDEKSKSILNITFDKLAVICVPKRNKHDVSEALETRAAKVPKLHDMKLTVSGLSGDALFGSILLAFSLYFTDKHGFSWVLPTVYSDEIKDLKEKKKAEPSIECLNPEEVPFGVSSPIAIYTKTPTTGLQKNDLKILFTFSNTESEKSAQSEKATFEQDVIEMKKHLLIAKTPVLLEQNERIKCEVSVQYNQFKTKEKLCIFFTGKLQSSHNKARGVAMKRTALSTDGKPYDLLLQGFY